MSSLPKYIAITGKEGSGKDSYGNHLAILGYMHISAGDVIRDRARLQGHTDPIPRATLSQIGDEMKKEFGPSLITESALADYEQKHATFPAGLVISGLRRAEELKAFKERGAVAIWIDASDDRRFANQSSRNRGDKQDINDFIERGKKEYLGNTDGGESGVNLWAIEALSDCRVNNDGTLEDLIQKADASLSKISQHLRVSETDHGV